MDELDIEKCLSEDFHARKVFKGTWPCNIYPRINYNLNMPSAYIVNLDNSEQEGSHWVALYVTNNFTYFFDTYARNPDSFNIHIQKYIRHVARSNCVKYISGKPLQLKTSSVCGFYCIFFIICLANDITFEDFINIFTNCEVENDSFICKLIKNMFPSISVPCNIY